MKGMINMALVCDGDKICIDGIDEVKCEKKENLIIGVEELRNKINEIKKVEIYSNCDDGSFDNLFKGFGGITDLYVSSNIKLGNEMFSGCENLKDVRIHNECVLGTGTFEGCKKLGHVVCGGDPLTGGLKSVGDRAFKDAKMDRFDGGGGITYIGESAFENCEIGDLYLNMMNLETIGNNAFKNSKFAKIYIDIGKLKFVGEGAFENAEGEFDFPSKKYDIKNIEKDHFKNFQGLVGCTEFIKRLKPENLDVSTMRKINRKRFRDMLREVGFENDDALHKVVNDIGNQQE